MSSCNSCLLEGHVVLSARDVAEIISSAISNLMVRLAIRSVQISHLISSIGTALSQHTSSTKQKKSAEKLALCFHATLSLARFCQNLNLILKRSTNIHNVNNFTTVNMVRDFFSNRKAPSLNSSLASVSFDTMNYIYFLFLETV